MANLSNINNKFIVTDGGNVLIGNTANSSGRLQIKDTQTSNFNDGLAITRNNAAQTGYINMVGGAFNFNSPGLSYKFRNNGTQTLELNSSGNATFTGNVGIGAAASDGNLHVRKTGINTGITNVLMNANFADGSNGTGLSIGYRTDETTAVLAARTATGNIAFYSYDGGWSESMRIKNDGNVGIGTDLPGTKLQVNQTNNDVYQLTLHNTHLSTTTKTRIGNWANDSKFSSNYMQSGGTKTQDDATISSWVQSMGGSLDIFDISRSPAGSTTLSSLMRIDSSGNVGIGATLPQAQLHINKDTSNSYATLRLEGANRGGIIEMYNQTSYPVSSWTTDQSGNIFFATSGAFAATSLSTKFTILTGGNVGIGTTSPATKLHVMGTIKLGGYSFIGEDLSDLDSLTIASDHTESIHFAHHNSGSYTTNMIINSSGNVGIGTTSPDITGFGYTTLTVVGGTTAGYAGVLELGSPTTNANGQNLGIIAFMDGSTRNAQIDVTRASSTSTSNMHFYTNGGSGIEKRMSILGTTGELVLGAPTTTTISTDPIHSLGSVNRASLTAAMYARLVMQERTGNWISFVDGTPTHYGTISRSGSGVNYGSNSDYRLKENVLDLTNSINKVKLLSPKTFNFIDRPDTTVTGFLAHEVQKIVSEAVTGEKDGTITTGNVINDSDGTILEQNITEPEKLETGTSFTAIKTEPEYQQLDQAKLVPILIGALKELIAKVETLENN
jgi:hypothetical protein